MGRVKRVEITWGLSWLIVAACGGTPVQEDMSQMQPSWMPTGGNRVTMPGAGAPGSGNGKRATARIEPFAPGSTTATPPADMSGAAGMTAAAAGASGGAAGDSAGAAGASAGASAAGASGSDASAAGATGSAGAGGTGMGAGLAAGSGGEGGAAADPAAGAAGMTGAAGMVAGTDAAGMGAGGMDAMAPTGAAGMPAPTTGTAGAGGADAPASITGTASFSSSSSGVSLMLMVSGCQMGKEYPIHIHQGSSCESEMAQGPHWDMTRGEGIPGIRCGMRQGATAVVRPNTDPATAWTIGDGSPTDVIGHVIVIHDADNPMQRIACGAIVMR
jgi:hypothetical protein